MKPNQWLTIASLQMQALPEKLDVLLARREWLFHQQQEVLGRLAALASETHALRERQTTHELQCHVFWRGLQQSTDAQQSDEAKTVPATESLPV